MYVWGDNRCLFAGPVPNLEGNNNSYVSKGNPLQTVTACALKYAIFGAKIELKSFTDLLVTYMTYIVT